MAQVYVAPSIVIGIDDTDNAESIGTGRLARMLAGRLSEHGWCTAPGVTRHQHLVHPDIPYTSHNSSACIGVVGPTDRLEELWSLCVAFLAEHEHPGADPGLCLAPAEAITGPGTDYGPATQSRVLAKHEAWDVAQSCGARLAELGGSGDGIIGALGAVCLRAGGSDGRFLDLEGIRDLAGTVSVERILAATAIQGVADADGCGICFEDLVVTNEWVRPQLRGGRPILIVHRHAEGHWVCQRDQHEP